MPHPLQQATVSINNSRIARGVVCGQEQVSWSVSQLRLHRQSLGPGQPHRMRVGELKEEASCWRPEEIGGQLED
jgi:hypothetical protein